MRTSRSRITACLLWPLLVMGSVAAYAEKPPVFHIQAHRGGGLALPENTLETFRWAWERGITPEADLRTTRDDVIVCFHDPNFQRVARSDSQAAKRGSIEELTAADAQRLDVGAFRGKQFAGQRIPKLEAVFQHMRGKPERQLYIDVKTVDLDTLASLVRQHEVSKQVIFTTTKYPLIREWKKRVPESMTLLWNGGSEDELRKKLDGVRASDFEGITHLQIHVKASDLESGDPFIPSTKFLTSLDKELADRGIVFQVLPWECSDPAVYERLLALGADSFATDYPELTLKAVHRFREKSQRQGTK